MLVQKFRGSQKGQNMQNSVRFRASSNFDRKYFRNEWRQN